MSAIRPLATIAVLAALGIFLALKINEQGPVALNDEGSLEPWNASAPGAAPTAEAPLFDAADTTLTPRTAPGAEGEAPAFSSGPTSATEPLAPASTNQLPELPPLPALPGAEPPVAPTADPTTPIAEFPRANSAETEISLPRSVPTASYPSANPETTPPSSPTRGDGVISGRVPSLGTSTGEAAAPASPFDAAWPLIQAALDRDELTRAHLLLSQWRAEPTLTDAQRADVNVLLDDLAGSVVYSADHRLEPPHTVQPGETLKTIAEQYGVTWQLLGKINGFARPDAVQPGQLVKVVRGPFAGEVSLAESELVLMVAGRYAGRFPVQLEGAAWGEGAWRVESKSESASPGLVLRGPTGTISLDDRPVADPQHRGRITVASRDASDLCDIFTAGSTVTIVR